MNIKEEVIVTESWHNPSDLYSLCLGLIRQEYDVSSCDKMKDLDDLVRKEFDKVGQYFFDQGRKYERKTTI